MRPSCVKELNSWQNMKSLTGRVDAEDVCVRQNGLRRVHRRKKGTGSASESTPNRLTFHSRWVAAQPTDQAPHLGIWTSS